MIHIDNQSQPVNPQTTEDYKNILNQALRPKESWTLDDQVTMCGGCQKAFIYVIRRKHHCRACGHIFCGEYKINPIIMNSCSDKYLDGILFAPDSEKFVRLCERCYATLYKHLKQRGVPINTPHSQKVLTLPIQPNEITPELEKQRSITQIEQIQQVNQEEGKQHEDSSLDHQDSELNPDYEENFNIRALFADDDTLAEDSIVYLESLKSKSKATIFKICEHLGKLYHFGPEWWETMTQYINQAVEEIFIQSQNNNEPIDIIHYVKIKKILHVDNSATHYIRGVVCRKNVSHKRMKTEFRDAKVMVLQGCLEVTEINGKDKSFEELVSSEKRLSKDIVKKVQKYKPDILFVEKSVNRHATELFLKNDIAVVQNIQHYILRKIAKSTKSKYLNFDKLVNIRLIKVKDKGKYKAEEVLGRAKRINFIYYDPEMIVRNKTLFDSLKDPQNNQALLLQRLKENQERDEVLMFLETESGNRGVTITLSGPALDTLQNLKKSMTGTLRLARHFHLESYMIIMDQGLKRKLQQTMTKEQLHIINQCTGDFSKFLYERIPIDDLIRKDSLIYTKIIYVQANLQNINDIQTDFGALEKYYKENKQMTVKIVDFFAELCPNQTFAQKKTEFYSKDDLSLGAFIILKVSKMKNQEICPNECQRQNHKHVSIYYGPGLYVRISVESIVFQQEPQPQENVEQIINFLTQRDLGKIQSNKPQSERMKIECWIECNLCGEKITDSVPLRGENFEYSFIRFLQYMFISGMGMKDVFGEQKVPCQHQKCSRVFSYEKALVKFFLNPFKQYSTYQVSILDEKVNEQLRKSDQEIITIRRDELIGRINSISDKLIAMVQLIISSINDEAKTSAHQFLKAELELLCLNISKNTLEARNMVVESRYKTIFELENDNNNIGLYYQVLHECLLESKRKKEIGAELKGLMKKSPQELFRIKLIEEAYIPHTAKELDLYEPVKEETQQSELSIRSDGQLELDSPPKITIYVPNSEDHNNNQYANSPLIVSAIEKTKISFHTDNNKQINTTQDLTDIQSMLSIKSKASAEASLSQQVLVQTQNKTHAPIEINFNKEWIMPSFQWEQDKTERIYQKFDYVPIYEHDQISYIAFALNNSKYMHEVYLNQGFQNFEDQKFPDLSNEQQVEFMKSKLAIGAQGDKEKDMVYTIRLFHDKQAKIEVSPNLNGLTSSIPQNRSPIFNHQPVPIIQEQSNPIDPKASMISKPTKQKFSEVLVYFPVQFEALRMVNGVSLQQFIKSVFQAQNWDAQGGKSDSCFLKSRDDLFVIKKLNEDKEFIMFKGFALEYFKHVYKLFYEKKPSLLSKILGMFEVRTRNSTGYYLVMENLYLGLYDVPSLLVYDLKGSHTNRWEQRKMKVLLDTNFKIDQNAEPIAVIPTNYRYIDRAFQNDCKFLNRFGIMDYSLLLMIDRKNQRLRLGIIDYLRMYTYDKAVENIAKTIILGVTPTIVKPEQYKKRFLDEMHYYFIEGSPEI